MSQNVIRVTKNRSIFWAENEPRAVYIYALGGEFSAVVSTQEARDIAAAFIAAADDFEALKPPEPRPQAKYEAMLDSLGCGAVLRSAGSTNLYVKLGNNNWHSVESGGKYENYCFAHYAGHEILFEGVKND